MKTIAGKILITLLVVFGVLVSSFCAAAGQAKRASSEEMASREVLARLTLSTKVKAKVNSIFAEYEAKITERQQAFDTALEGYGTSPSGASADAAREKSREELNKYLATIHERDAKVKQALPPALATKFERGLKLVNERNDKLGAILMEIATTDADTKDKKKEYKATKEEYNKKLDAEVGKVKKQE